MPNAADWVEAYAMFPARGELTKDKRSEEISPHRLARAGLGFRLGMRLHPKLTAAQREEVNTALRWWASFGGVGARTRRGLGAVRVEGLTPVTNAEVAAKGGRLILLALSETPELAWKNSVGRLRQFRQGVDLGRNQKTEGSESPRRTQSFARARHHPSSNETSFTRSCTNASRHACLSSRRVWFAHRISFQR